MKWPRPEWTVLAILVIAVAVVLFIVRPPLGGSPRTASEAAESAAQPEEHHQETEEEHTLAHGTHENADLLDEQTRQLVSEALSIYGSFPNSEGSSATLTKLRSLSILAPSATAQIEQEWAGPVVQTVQVQVQNVQLAGEILGAKPGSIIVTALVSQQATHAATPPVHTAQWFTVTLEREDARWMITEIYQDGT